jgi:hypothetical protein
MASRTQQAIDWLNVCQTRTQAEAAQFFGLTQSAISAGIARRRKSSGQFVSHESSWRDPVRQERLQCAILAEKLGASHVAAAILKRG